MEAAVAGQEQRDLTQRPKRKQKRKAERLLSSTHLKTRNTKQV
jgi:hypothetical protein